ncbi:ABC1 family protein (chaperonin), putative (macronuclear) [Tetrahymena thermophila SB210]|uniref:ABC1 family protein (Chaperonin), putative n=1 Tax=Tetrahymena thermophila (strain SB210) TaxID=312017 RepID=Q22MU1_TETTS|nr:ABC1 family protein (chaperonin), putative [Tetrahymena thermophila SB210]EAR86296.1 ABC1 family protein (chaperonin), putative [Tetrahymena thermophila SB210]|eukprot:XP_976929.1 ABC1 family protein (chaperonin), putative [Tetrahymena thermophila SB210]
MFRHWKKMLGLGMAGYAGYDYTTREKIMWRNLRTLKAGAVILINYKWRFSPENVEQIHEETAEELYNMCRENDGLYVKFGQAVAASEHMLPPSYFKWFSLLQDKAKAVEYEAVRKIIKEDLGSNPEDIFEEFEQEPVASASIAQVHRAKLKTGETVAVKIQKPNIQKQFGYDMFMHKLFLQVLEYAFDLPLTPFHESIEENLAKEIDFNIEAENSKKCKILFQKLGRKEIYVPNIYDQYTSKRTLVMEWIDGIKITEESQLVQQGYDIKGILNSIIEAFAEQIFITGFTHADPHPGNLLVRRNPQDTQKQQIVLLDYGLCFQVSENFRLQYCSLWKSLFLQDSQALKDIVKQWGIQDDEQFASFQLMRPYNKNKPLTDKISKEDVYNLQMKFKGDFKKMLGDTNKFPKDLLFINRNMNLVRSINKKLGSQVNRINLMAKYSVKGLHEDTNTLKKKFNLIWFETRLMFSSIFYKLVQAWFKFFKGKGFEDILDEEMKKAIQQKYAEYGMVPPDEKTFNA